MLCLLFIVFAALVWFMRRPPAVPVAAVADAH
jgi:hypothetical protein